MGKLMNLKHQTASNPASKYKPREHFFCLGRKLSNNIHNLCHWDIGTLELPEIKWSNWSQGQPSSSKSSFPAWVYMLALVGPQIVSAIVMISNVFNVFHCNVFQSEYMGQLLLAHVSVSHCNAGLVSEERGTKCFF